MKKEHVFGVVCLAVSIFASNAFAQFLDPPFANNTVTSDYGPRVVSIGSWFHAGIDYSPAAGDDDGPCQLSGCKLGSMGVV